MSREETLKILRNGLIVSCQAEDSEPLGSPVILSALAQTVVEGGAVGIRAEKPDNIKEILKKVPVPVIGLYKKKYSDSEIFITPTLREALLVKQTGVPIIALDATHRRRPGGEKTADIINELRQDPSPLLVADISNLEEGLQAADLGFDFIATTLAGYTSYSRPQLEPDFELISELGEKLNGRVPVIAEGRFWSPPQVVEALRRGAYAVVVGSAITRPALITQRFYSAMKQYLENK